MCGIPSSGELAGHLAVLVLTVAWLALTGLKVAEYMSEPTATRNVWKKVIYLPPFTVCPALRLPYVLDANVTDAVGEGATLEDFYDQLGLDPLDFLAGLSASQGRSYESCDSGGDCVNFTKSFDYDVGGMCLTSKAASSGFHFNLVHNLAYAYGISDYILTFDIILHGQPDFYGAAFADETILYLSSVQRGIKVSIRTDRRIEANLKRDPCNDNPTYSKRLCERQCYFNWLNCSVLDAVDLSKPRCLAADGLWIQLLDPLSKFAEAADGIDACQCPKECVTDTIHISIEPDYYVEEHDNITSISLLPSTTMNILETYVTYTFSDLMADMGGFLGLLLGSSLLSVCQLLPQMTKWACTKCRGERQDPEHGLALNSKKDRVATQALPAPTDRRRGDIVVCISPRVDGASEPVKY
ncbi:uncharacterized protein LOC122390575 [Amphibalanus amphitrite]|uniref:uncharacterized protein LOC122390575 n=1 Tax=Amphibalanus amphitrite TaxID=1232801 RepID=UPI001C905644|nr:uncharacterized protein LOC122390575 [Amphibalanus amphitrite]